MKIIRIACAIFVLSSCLAAQTRLLDVPLNAPNAFPNFSAIGDVNGDGRSDFVVRTLLGPTVVAALEVRSGDAGSLLYAIASGPAGDNLGNSLAAAGDVDLDGVPDFIAGAPFSDVGGTDLGFVEVRSGVDGSVLLHVPGSNVGAQFGSAVCAVGDANGDGKIDLAVATNPFGTKPGAVTLHSGASGAVLRTWSGAPGKGFGFSIAGPGDLDGDGAGDVAVVVENDAVDTRVYSGGNGSMLLGQAHGSGQVAPGGDLDADGTIDLLVLANAGNDGTGRVISGATGVTLLDFGHGGDFFTGPYGSSIDLLGDVTGDGKPDYVLGEVGVSELEGRARVFSGSGGSELYSLDEFTDVNLGPIGTSTFGSRVATLGDVNGDGTPDFGVAGPQHVAAYSGTVDVLSELFAGWVTPFSPDLFCHGELKAGAPTTLRVESITGGQRVFVVAGLGEVDLPLHGGILIPAPQLVIGPLVADAAGNLEFAAHWPPGMPSGTTVYAQAWLPSTGVPQGWLSTNGVRGVVP